MQKDRACYENRGEMDVWGVNLKDQKAVSLGFMHPCLVLIVPVDVMRHEEFREWFGHHSDAEIKMLDDWVICLQKVGGGGDER